MTKDGVTLLTARSLLRRGAESKHDELWDGVLCIRAPSGGFAEVVAMRVARALFSWLETRYAEDAAVAGWVTGSSQGFLIRRAPDRVLSPDVAFTSRTRLPEVPPRGYFPCAPDFAVEVRSPEQTRVTTTAKCGVWIAHGVDVVWGIDPESREVAVFGPCRNAVVRGSGDVATAEPALGGFSVFVDDLFVGLA